MSGTTLLTRYRPASWEQVVGHEEILSALRRSLAEPTRPHAFLFTGPSGIGKTTIARIVAKELDSVVDEIDAASNSGVDAMRTLMEISTYIPMGRIQQKMLIIDECHALSKSAWQAALKILEEPPPHLYIALCTTELPKVPETIQTRCFHVPLRQLRAGDIEDLLLFVAEMEGWKVGSEVLGAVLQAATGQPRKALTILQAVHAATNKDEVSRIITLIEDDDAYIELARALLEDAPWVRVAAVLPKLNLDDVEQSMIGFGRYFANVLLQEGVTESKAHRAWRLLDALVFPSQSWDKRAVFIAAIGRMVWGE